MKIQLKDANIAIGDLMILNNVTLELKDQSLIRIQGANGSGKTVLINTLLGLNHVKQGMRFIDFNRKEICYIQDSPFFFDDETVASILDSYFRIYQVSRTEIYEALKALRFDVRVNDLRKVAELSKGMRKKLLILPLFFASNSFYVLDEVFTGLDGEAQTILIERIHALIHLGVALILIEHNEGIFNAIAVNLSSERKWEVFTCVNGSVVRS